MGGIKASPNKGKDLKGLWHVTLKIDGARMLRRADGTPVSRADKPLYNLEGVSHDITDAEIYATNWETSMGLVRRSINGSPVPKEFVYSLDPLDSRLDLGVFRDPDHEFLQTLMANKVKEGFEGLVVRQGDKWLKYKPSDTVDIPVTGIQEGTGKHLGKMGALLTDYGKVGTGFDDAQRAWWQLMYDLHGLQWLTKQIIECSFMEWTKGGKMRHPVFEKHRTDKTEVNLGESYENMFGLRGTQK